MHRVARLLLAVALLGFGLSFFGTAPMTGPVALLVLDRALSGQRGSATWIASAGVLVEGVIAGGVATFLPDVLSHSEAMVSLARFSGALVIVAVGSVLVLFPEVLQAVKTEHRRESFVAGALTAALNPTLLATWTLAVTALHAAALLPGGGVNGFVFGAGVALGALTWFGLVISLLGKRWRVAMQRHRRAFGRAVGLVLLLVGVALGVSVASSELASGPVEVSGGAPR